MNENIGWVGSYDGDILKTFDSGLTWSLIADLQIYRVQTIFFIDESTGWVIGGAADGNIYKTTDGGLTWVQKYSGYEWFTDMQFLDYLTGYIVSWFGNVWKTTDGGEIWEQQNIRTFNDFESVFFVSPDTGWIVGQNGTILKTINGGIITSLNEQVEVQTPNKLSLSQNYPNPFNPTTTIRFTISELRFTTLKIYDVLGSEVATLVNEEKPAGEYEIEFSTGLIHQTLSSGVYFYQLRAGNFIETKKMLLLK